MNPSTSAASLVGGTESRSAWLFSWPLVVGTLTYLYALLPGSGMLSDGDSYWHIATGRWIIENAAIPSTDPFSQTMQGRIWTAQSWLSELILAQSWLWASWTGAVAVTALAFAAAMALLTRALLRHFEPLYALLFVALAVGLIAPHLLVRPHVLIMPLMVLWSTELVHACDEGRAPRWPFILVMPLWANLHGGFTIGLALAGALATEAVINAPDRARRVTAVRAWGLFLAASVAGALATPHGLQGILYTWQTFTDAGYSLTLIREWQSPDFQRHRPFEIWVLFVFGTALFLGIRLPPMRVLILLGLLHLALMHARAIENLGLVAPLLVGQSLAQRFGWGRPAPADASALDELFHRLVRPAGLGAVAVSTIVLATTSWTLHLHRPPTPPAGTAPEAAIRAVEQADIRSPVLNGYGWGGYLIHRGIHPFIDGRADMYGEKFLREYRDATSLKTSEAPQHLLDKYQIGWTLFPVESPIIAVLDRIPGWGRLYTDSIAVVHVRVTAGLNGDAPSRRPPADRTAHGEVPN